MTITVSPKAARLFLLQKQLLWSGVGQSRRKLKGKKGIARVFEKLRIIQFDPLNPCGRNPDLVLQSRVLGIHPEDYFVWLYQQRKGVEYYDKELCILPLEDLKYCSSWYRAGDGSRTGSFLIGHKKELRKLLQRIKQRGQVSSLELLDSRVVDIWWGPVHWGKGALDSLWRSGQVVISERRNGKKYYHLPRFIYGTAFKIPTPGSMHRYASARVLRRVNAVGMLSKSGAGTGWLGMGKSKELAEVIRRLLKQGKLSEVSVSGVSRSYVIDSHDLPRLKKAEKLKTPKPRMLFLAPLDNLLWDRQMVKELFGFSYVWEVYTPQAKRRHGYYVLPVLYGDRFVARIEPVLKGNQLLLKGFWLEPEVKWDSNLNRALASALKDFSAYLQAKKIAWQCAKPRT